MRKAIIVTNPKWADYASTAAKFKTLEAKPGEEHVLVISSLVKKIKGKPAAPVAEKSAKK